MNFGMQIGLRASIIMTMESPVCRYRSFTEGDATEVASLIAETYKTFCSNEADAESLERFLHDLTSESDSKMLYQKLFKPIMILAVTGEAEIVGIIAGTQDRINKMFVKIGFQRRGIATQLFGHFESEVIRAGASEIKVRSSLFAERFYSSVGFKKTTGVRSHGGMLHYPMRKPLSRKGQSVSDARE